MSITPPTLPGLVRATLAISARAATDPAQVPRALAALANRPRHAGLVRQWQMILGALGLDLVLVHPRLGLAVDVRRCRPDAADRASGLRRATAIYRRGYLLAPSSRRLQKAALDAAVQATVAAYVAARRRKIAACSPADADAVRALGRRPLLERAVRAVVAARGIAALELQAATGASAATVRHIVTAGRPAPLAVVAGVLDDLDWHPVLRVGSTHIPCRWGLGADRQEPPVRARHQRTDTIPSLPRA